VIVCKADWTSRADVKAMFRATVDFVSDDRIILGISGNKYRLIVDVAYAYDRVLIKFVGTHKEYDRINPETVKWIGQLSDAEREFMTAQADHGEQQGGGSG